MSVDFANFNEITYTPPKKGLGYVYHLFNTDDMLLYVGHTTNIYIGIGKHILNKKCVYKIKYWEVPLLELTNIVAEHIIKFNPPLNKVIPQNNKWMLFSTYIRINPVVKGKAVKIKKILKEKGWEYQRDCLMIHQWEEIANILLGEQL